MADYVNGWLTELAQIMSDMNTELESAKAENAKLRELVYDMLVDEEREHNDDLTFDEHVERANELGVEFRA